MCHRKPAKNDQMPLVSLFQRTPAHTTGIHGQHRKCRANPSRPLCNPTQHRRGFKRRVTGEVMLRRLLGSRGYMYPIHRYTGLYHWNIKLLMRTYTKTVAQSVSYTSRPALCNRQSISAVCRLWHPVALLAHSTVVCTTRRTVLVYACPCLN